MTAAIREGSLTEEILINVTPQETRVAVIQQGVVQEVQVERASARGLVGNIYMGRVVRVLPGMQSAFVDIGGGRAAFLHVADIWGHRQDGEEARPIEKLLAEGQHLLVQVVKDPIGTKGARLSTQVSIAGRLLVYLPQESHIGISQRIEDEEERLHLREKLQQLLPTDVTGGFIIRTMAGSGERPRVARRHRVSAQAVEGHPGQGAWRRAGGAALPGSGLEPARAARLCATTKHRAS